MPIVDMSLEDLKKYNGINPCPEDFEEYWRKAKRELKDIEPKIELTPAQFQVPFCECYDLYYTGVKGARIHAKYLKPKESKGKHPALLQFHGYSSNSGDWNDKLQYVALGFSVFAMDCRGQGGFSQDVGGIKGNTLQGHIIRGIDDEPDQLLYRDIFLDAAQLARIAFDMEDIDNQKVYACGYSQGGGITLACAALEPRISKLAPVYPFLCDYKRVWEMDLLKDAYIEIKQYFRLFDPIHEREDAVFKKLGYIDVQNLVSRIKGKVLFTTGLMDTICPPSTQYAAYNKIQAPKEHIIYPDFGHEQLPQLNDRILQFFME